MVLIGFLVNRFRDSAAESDAVGGALRTAIATTLELSDAHLALAAYLDLHDEDSAEISYNMSMATHDHAITLSNQLVTRGGGDGAIPNSYNASGFVRAEFDGVDAARRHNSTLHAAADKIHRELERAAANASEFAMLSFLELARASPLRDAEVPLATFFNASAEWRAPPPAAASAALVAELARQTLATSRMYFAFGNLCDADALKGFAQWCRWRSRSDLANAMTLVHYLAQRRAPYVALPYEAAGGGGGPAALLDVALAAERRKAALLNELYGAALAEGDALGTAFLRSASAQVRWTRTGDATDEPEWPESLLYSQQRKVEDVAKIAAILKMAKTAPGQYYVDHQMPDTVP
jgi:ferritin